MNPLISICLPSLNTHRYLGKRMESILRQTHTHWELIIVDDGSSDGSVEFFKHWEKQDDRIRLFKGPQKGLYAGWNDAIERVRGEFVYIATSDDTMADDCLERLVAALQKHSQCDLAHCSLRVIDEHDQAIQSEWYPNGPFMRSSGSLAQQTHIRFAPLDGFLHLGGASVYAAITQLLIRRSLFDTVGLFDSRWGPMGDFHWNMRASFATNTIHVPGTWGSWRLHGTQATAVHSKIDFYNTVQSMIDDAITVSMVRFPDRLASLNLHRWQGYVQERRTWWTPENSSRANRAIFLFKKLLRRSPVLADYVQWKLGLGNDFVEEPIDLLLSWYLRHMTSEPFQVVRD